MATKKSRNIFPIILLILMVGAFIYLIKQRESALLPTTSKPTVAEKPYVPKPIPTPANLDEKLVFKLVNDEREKMGLTLLVWDDNLLKSATNKIDDMCEKKYWAHTSPDGKEPWSFIKAVTDYGEAGENLGKDFVNASELVRSWMTSPTHKENIIKGVYRKSAVAIKRCDLYGVSTQLIVQHFTSPPVVNSTVVNDPNAPIHCNIHPDCGGGTIPLKQFECENSTCCQMRDKSWKFYTDRSKCTSDQNAGL